MALSWRRRSERRIEGDLGPARGQALVEFALVVPIMALLFSAVIQFAIIFERQIGIENAVRDAARAAATLETDSSNASTNGQWAWNRLVGSGGLLQNNVQSYDGLALGNPLVCYSNGTDTNGDPTVLVKITLGYHHPLFMPLITQLVDGLDTLQDQALLITTSAQFEVQNADPTSISPDPICYP